MSFLVLVTGSREWKDRRRLFRELDALLADFLASEGEPAVFTVLHGACPAGADLHAAMWCSSRGELWPGRVQEMKRPANWDLHGKAAGPVRNQEMADLKPGLCLAFFEHGAGNRGTADCVRRCRDAGIRIESFSD